MGVIFSRIKISRKYVVVLFLFTIIAAISEMMLPTMISFMIDKGVKTTDKNIIIQILIIMFIMAIFSCLSSVVTTIISTKIAAKFSADLRSEIFDKIQKFSAIEFDKFGTNSLITRSTSDIANIQSFLSFLLKLGITAPLMAIAGLIFSSITGTELSSVLYITIPVLIISASIVIFFVSKYSTLLRKKIDNINKLFLEAIEGIRVIRAFNKQNYEISRFENANSDYTNTSLKFGIFMSTLMPLINFIFGMTTAFIMGFGALLISKKNISIGILIANIQYINMILISLIMFAMVVMLFPAANACAKRVSEVLNIDISILDGKYDVRKKNMYANVKFENVTFFYEGAQEAVLKNISFESTVGQITAIVGSTGSGKSSILKLIPRFYDATYGKIYIDGVDVRDYKLEDLRNLIGYVPQKNILFSGNISSNLCIAKENAKFEDIENICKVACMEDFIKNKEDIYDFKVAQGGNNLSGGQRQRMSIARTVIKKPEIYLFDDSFSALDMKTDKKLRNNLKSNFKNSTVIMIAQKISSIIDADKIIVLKNGSIVGQGTHQQLLKNCPLYYEIAQLQLEEGQ